MNPSNSDWIQRPIGTRSRKVLRPREGRDANGQSLISGSPLTPCMMTQSIIPNHAIAVYRTPYSTISLSLESRKSSPRAPCLSTPRRVLLGRLLRENPIFPCQFGSKNGFHSRSTPVSKGLLVDRFSCDGCGLFPKQLMLSIL